MAKYSKKELPLQIALMIAESEASVADITEIFDKTKHILAVAQKMRDMAEKYHVNPDDAYVLGLVHDKGCELSDRNQAFYGGAWLRRTGLKHWEEVFFHGRVQSDYDSPLLQLLNFAEMTTSSNGKDVTMQEKINELIKLYGEDTPQVNDAKELVDTLDALEEKPWE